MLTVNNLALRRGGEILFENSTFAIRQGQRVGLIGANGTGKTSFLRLITGELDADTGLLDLPAGTRIAHLEQEVPASSEQAIDYVLAGDKELIRLNNALARAERDGEYEKVGDLHEQLASIDGYAARARAEQLMVGLGFGHDEFEHTLASFSGGWRIRLNLARTLMAPSDLLLLDEPTNHLDLDAILWLSDWIRGYTGTLLLISHDREFLDETVDAIGHLHHQRIELFSGNYSQFERLRAARLAEQQSNFEKQQREIRHMQDFVRRFRAKATKARQAQSRLKALQRMALIAPAHIDSPFSFEIPATPKTSNPLLQLDQAVAGYSSAVLSEVRVTLGPGDRVGLLGHNGAGKSTLMKTLSGELPLLDGLRQEGTNLRSAYFSQHQIDELDLGSTAFQHIQRLDRDLPEQRVRNFLGGFDFHGDKVFDPVDTFSGGEKARLALAIVTFSKPNLLLMDEPTNHLDMDMRQALTVALQSFAGAIVLISHDRHLLANTVDEFLLVHGGSVEPFKGDLDDYRRRLFGELAASASATASPPADKEPAEKPAKADHRQVRQLRTRLRTIETRLSRLQEKLAAVESSLADASLYSAESDNDLHQLLREQVGLKDSIVALEEEWFERTHALENLQP